MKTILPSLLSFSFMLALALPGAAEEDNQWIGKKVMATMDSALSVGQERQPVSSDDLPLTVSKVQGEWLWVGQGWIKKSQVVSLQEAPAYYSRNLQTNSASAETYYRRGIAYMALGQFSQAIADFTEAIRLNPANLGAIGDRANARYNNGDYEGAIADYSLVLEKLPRSATAFKYRGDSLQRRWESTPKQGQLQRNKEYYARAMADYDAAIAINPNYAEAYVARGYMKTPDLDYGGAIRDYDAAIRIDPNYALAFQFRGDAVWGQAEWDTEEGQKTDLKELERALADFNKSIELQPSAPCYYKRAQLYAELEKAPLALDDYQEALRLEPEYRALYFDRGKLYIKLWRIDEALLDFTRAIDLDPQEQEAYSERARIYEMKGNLDKAIDDYTILIGLAPKEISYYIRRGRVLFNQASFAAALEDFEQAIQIKPFRPFGYAERAWVHATASDPKFRDGEQALADGQRAVKFVESGRNYEVLAAALAEQRDFAAALDSLAKANKIDPSGNPDVRAQMRAAFEAGKPYRSLIKR